MYVYIDLCYCMYSEISIDSDECKLRFVSFCKPPDRWQAIVVVVVVVVVVVLCAVLVTSSY
jgi:hypothetical protein